MSTDYRKSQRRKALANADEISKRMFAIWDADIARQLGKMRSVDSRRCRRLRTDLEKYEAAMRTKHQTAPAAPGMKQRIKLMSEILTPSTSSRWDEFANRLVGEMCVPGGPPDRCDHTHRYAKAIMADMGEVDIPGTIEFLDAHGGHCDCEILLNVDPACRVFTGFPHGVPDDTDDAGTVFYLAPPSEAEAGAVTAKLWAEHETEGDRQGARFGNMGWVQEPRSVLSKTDRGRLHSSIDPTTMNVTHHWEPYGT